MNGFADSSIGTTSTLQQKQRSFGAGGGVGTFGIQIAKLFDAEVTEFKEINSASEVLM